MKLFIAGGAGFIGSTYARFVLERRPRDEITILDKFTYAGRRENLAPIAEKVTVIEGDICDRELVGELVRGSDAIVNFAAETHVDRSIDQQSSFLTTQVEGTGVLLDAHRAEGVNRFVQVSTDEVYGPIMAGSATEEHGLYPSSPYSAAKAGADLLVGAHVKTYGLDALICRGSNAFGPYQYPEKLVPLCIVNAVAGHRVPLYGSGRQVRNWLYVDDFVNGIDLVLRKGSAGHVYNIGGPAETENRELVSQILILLGAQESLISYVQDRPGHDRRYSLCSEKLQRLGWTPLTPLSKGLTSTVRWYQTNREWWLPLVEGAEATRRRGIA